MTLTQRTQICCVPLACQTELILVLTVASTAHILEHCIDITAVGSSDSADRPQEARFGIHAKHLAFLQPHIGVRRASPRSLMRSPLVCHRLLQLTRGSKNPAPDAFARNQETHSCGDVGGVTCRSRRTAGIMHCASCNSRRTQRPLRPSVPTQPGQVGCQMSKALCSKNSKTSTIVYLFRYLVPITRFGTEWVGGFRHLSTSPPASFHLSRPSSLSLSFPAPIPTDDPQRQRRQRRLQRPRSPPVRTRLIGLCAIDNPLCFLFSSQLLWLSYQVRCSLCPSTSAPHNATHRCCSSVTNACPTPATQSKSVDVCTANQCLQGTTNITNCAHSYLR